MDDADADVAGLDAVVADSELAVGVVVAGVVVAGVGFGSGVIGDGGDGLVRERAVRSVVVVDLDEGAGAAGVIMRSHVERPRPGTSETVAEGWHVAPWTHLWGYVVI